MAMWNWNPDLTFNSAVTLAQGDGGPQLGGVPSGGGGTTNGGAGTTGDPAGGSGAGGGGGGGTGGSGFEFMLPILLVFGVVMIWAMFRQKREQKKRDRLLGGIKKRDRVQTIGGVIGSVTEIKSDTVVLKVDESSNTRMTFARSAIQQIISDAPDKSSSEESVEEKAE